MQLVQLMQSETNIINYKKSNKMNETINELKKIAHSTEDAFLLSRVNLLEHQIKIALLDAKINEVKGLRATLLSL